MKKKGPTTAQDSDSPPKGEAEDTMARQGLKHVTMLMLLLTMTLVTAVATANGQSHRVTASVPFEFIVGDKTLPAADYRIATVGEALAIRSADAKNNVIRLANATPPSQNRTARLVFHRYGSTYFLSEVWEGGDRTGRCLIESREERALKRELSKIATGAKGAYEEVVILATTR